MSELKKISAYVPEELYECLQKDKEEGKISLSQAIIAALANHYNIEVTVGKSGRRVTLGGETATVQRVEALENKFAEFSSNITEQLEQVLSAIQSKEKTINRENIDHKQSGNGTLTTKNQSIDRLLKPPIVEYEETQLACLPLLDIEPFSGRLLGLRLDVHKNTPASRKKKPREEFKAWSSEKDPDSIAWIPNPNDTGYIPSQETTSEQLAKLQQWIDKQID